MEAMLSAYCERAGAAGVLAEPLNLATNAAFLVAAWLAWRRLAATPGLSARRDWDIAGLIAIVVVIGLGSAAWHAVPLRATLLADVLPITLFIHLYLLIFSIRVLGLRWPWAVLILALFVAGGSAFGRLVPPGALNGSGAYLPAWIMLVIMTAWLFAAANPSAAALGVTLGVWTVSLIARSTDRAICPAFPIGTHFLWHTLNAVVLYLLLALLVRDAERRRLGPADRVGDYAKGAQRSPAARRHARPASIGIGRNR